MALKHHINLSCADMDFIKWFANDFMHIPNRQYIKNHTDNLIPSPKSCRDDKGICGEGHRQPIQLTIERLIDVLHSQNIDVPKR